MGDTPSSTEPASAPLRYGLTDNPWLATVVFFAAAALPFALPLPTMARSWLGIFLGALVVAGLSRTGGTPPLGLAAAPPFGWAAAAAAYGIAAFTAAPLWSAIIPDAFGSRQPVGWVMGAGLPPAMAWAVSSAALEEAFFRGILLPRMDASMRMRSILRTAALFAVVHLDPASWPQLFFDGTAYGLLRRLSGSVWSPLIAHAVYNVLALGSWAGPR